METDHRERLPSLLSVAFSGDQLFLCNIPVWHVRISLIFLQCSSCDLISLFSLNESKVVALMDSVNEHLLLCNKMFWRCFQLATRYPRLHPGELEDLLGRFDGICSSLYTSEQFRQDRCLTAEQQEFRHRPEMNISFYFIPNTHLDKYSLNELYHPKAFSRALQVQTARLAF